MDRGIENNVRKGREGKGREEGHFPAISITSPDKIFFPKVPTLRILGEFEKEKKFLETEFEVECQICSPFLSFPCKS